MTTQMPSLCLSCKNLKTGPTCAAFPQGIPDEIMFYGGDHRKSWPGQDDLTLHELQDGKEQQYEDWVFTYALQPE